MFLSGQFVSDFTLDNSKLEGSSYTWAVHCVCVSNLLKFTCVLSVYNVVYC